MSLEKLAIQNLRRHYGRQFEVLHGDFPKTAADAIWKTRKKQCWAEDGYETAREAYAGLRAHLRRLWPDAYAIDKKEQVLVCFEIEDTSKLTEEKIIRYHEAFWQCDLYWWSLSLVTTDRYGAAKVSHYLPCLAAPLYDK